MEVEGRGGEAKGEVVREWCEAKYVTHCDRSPSQYAFVLFTG